ncbi:MAG: GNAT family N-acetyltransferase [Chloroflexi bacterium]|nr:GNAT family N-acetyltransferase [Chloroflexota bacterium]
MTLLLEIESYPKTIVLRDGTKVELRPLEQGDKVQLHRFFQRIPEEDKYYLKGNVVAPEVIREWTSNIDFEKVIPIVAVMDGEIIADASLHRSRAPARRLIGELRIVVDPAYREIGLGGRLIRELLDIAVYLGLHKATFELVDRREESAINAAESMGFKEVAALQERIVDMWGNHQDLILLELSIKDVELWWRF